MVMVMIPSNRPTWIGQSAVRTVLSRLRRAMLAASGAACKRACPGTINPKVSAHIRTSATAAPHVRAEVGGNLCYVRFCGFGSWVGLSLMRGAALAYGLLN